MAVPQPGGTSGYGNLYAVACPSARDCWAVGHYHGLRAGGNEALRWNGRHWLRRIAPRAGPSYPHELVSVSCASADRCWAVGGEQLLHWNGHRWRATARA